MHRGYISEYRGLDSDFWALYNREFNKIGVAIHHLDAQLDTGPVVRQEVINIKDKFEIPNQLKHRIIENNVKTIYICLDKDARKQAIETAEYFMANGVDVYFVDIKEKDPSDIGFGKINNILANTEKLTSEWLMEQRILGI